MNPGPRRRFLLSGTALTLAPLASSVERLVRAGGKVIE